MSAAAVSGRAACPPEVWVDLCAQKNQIVQKVTGKRHQCVRSVEWAALTLELRMAALLVAGIDGDLGELSRRGWREMPPEERVRVQGVLRSFHRALEGTLCLRARWMDDEN